MDFPDKMDLENERVLKLIFPDGVPGEFGTGKLRNGQSSCMFCVPTRQPAWQSGVGQLSGQAGHLQGGTAEEGADAPGRRGAQHPGADAGPGHLQLQDLYHHGGELALDLQ